MNVIKSRIFILLFALTIGENSYASSPFPFTKNFFADAQNQGKWILLDLHSYHCGACLGEQNVLEKILDEPKYKEITWVILNYDGPNKIEGSASQKFKVDHSGLILYHGKKEMGRAASHLDEAALRKLLNLEK